MLDRIEASDRRLRRFVADASHELRTPLAAVSAYAELFGRGADKRPEDLARAMSGITRESDRMKELVEDLLLLARLDEGQPLERAPVELGELAAEAVETARALDPSRPLDLEAQPATVLGDRARLRRVLDNLLGNVRSHTPADTPAHVRVTTLNGSAVLEVSDEGPGLPPEDFERVFTRFYRADTSRSRESGGVGLGLSIVAAIADAHARQGLGRARARGRRDVPRRAAARTLDAAPAPGGPTVSGTGSSSSATCLERVLDARERSPPRSISALSVPAPPSTTSRTPSWTPEAVAAAPRRDACPGRSRRRACRCRGRCRSGRCRRRPSIVSAPLPPSSVVPSGPAVDRVVAGAALDPVVALEPGDRVGAAEAADDVGARACRRSSRR